MKIHTIKEASKLTKMSESWWRKQVLERKIEYLKVGKGKKGRVFIPQTSIDDLFKRSIVKPHHGY